MTEYEKLGLSNTREMLKKAETDGYAVPGYNFNNLEQLQAIIRACAETQSPVILQVSKGARNYVGGSLLSAMARGATEYARQIGMRAPIALHLDHGETFEICKECIDAGFSSVMIDGSALPLDDNIALTRRVVEYAHKFDVSVEGELGALAGIEDDHSAEKSHYTDPNDVARFVQETGVDSLAISIGTSHGAYKFKSETDELRLDILDEVAAKLPGFPLVLHGASSVPQNLVAEINQYGGKLAGARGIPEAQLRAAVAKNICKINVDSDSRLAFTAGVRKFLTENPTAFDPRSYLGAARDAMTALYKDKNLNVLNSANRY
ncbi:MAG: class II fructose-1,6-bisphosphate aldolase [Rickettsiales bacterium]|jgi:fructose-bisphosphate aldolase class II|nr:class II fructose-1,6-bisphosphate aldolase [Rickettsiales bacterium]